MPQISIVIPVYNTSTFLKQCLETVANQTFRDTEIICVNDGSTDDSLSIIEEFAAGDSRFIIINRKTASGSAALPRNIGLDTAQSKYVMFLDADDYFDLTMLEKLYTRAEETGADVVMCDNYRVSHITGEISEKDSELHETFLPKLGVFSYKDIPDTIFQISNAAVWHKLILRELITRNNLRFQLNAPILDDICFVGLLLMVAEHISIIRDRLVYYRVSRFGGQTAAIAKHGDSVFLSLHELQKQLAGHSLYEPVKTSFQKWSIALLFWWVSSINDFNTFCKMLDLYRAEYFRQLGLIDVDPGYLPDNVKRFYNFITGSEKRPPLVALLESGLTSGSKIAIYGAGLQGHFLYDMIMTQGRHEVVLWCDKNAGKPDGSHDSINIKHPSELASYDFDILIISIANCKIVDDVKKYLSSVGVDSYKVRVLEIF